MMAIKKQSRFTGATGMGSIESGGLAGAHLGLGGEGGLGQLHGWSTRLGVESVALEVGRHSQSCWRIQIGRLGKMHNSRVVPYKITVIKCKTEMIQCARLDAKQRKRAGEKRTQGLSNAAVLVSSFVSSYERPQVWFLQLSGREYLAWIFRGCGMRRQRERDPSISWC